VTAYITAVDKVGHTATYPGKDHLGGEIAGNFLLAYAAVAAAAFFFGMTYGRRT
jgi:hypothetical protein